MSINLSYYLLGNSHKGGIVQGILRAPALRLPWTQELGNGELKPCENVLAGSHSWTWSIFYKERNEGSENFKYSAQHDTGGSKEPGFGSLFHFPVS